MYCMKDVRHTAVSLGRYVKALFIGLNMKFKTSGCLEPGLLIVTLNRKVGVKISTVE